MTGSKSNENYMSIEDWDGDTVYNTYGHDFPRFYDAVTYLVSLFEACVIDDELSNGIDDDVRDDYDAGRYVCVGSIYVFDENSLERFPDQDYQPTLVAYKPGLYLVELNNKSKTRVVSG